MKIAEWLTGAKRKIDALDAELVALSAFAPEGVDRSWLAAHGDSEASGGELKAANEMLARRVAGEPLAYIFGFKEFYGRKFEVSPEVLIPRPETETLVELIKELDLPVESRFLEIGTGSGCITATLAVEFPQSFVMATDVSEGALRVAKENCRTVLAGGSIGGEVRGLRVGGFVKGDAYGVLEERAEFYQGDLLEGLPEDLTGFDVLVANLPYVDKDWGWLDKNVLGFEPDLALYAEDEGLALYRKLIMQIVGRGDGFVKYVVFEADPCQHGNLIRFAESQGWRLLKTEGFGLVWSVESADIYC